jgi:hypothetical protein
MKYTNVNMWKKLLIFNQTDPSFPANFPLFAFTAKILIPSYSAHIISMDPLLSYINCCTSHYSSVMFWIWFCLDRVKVLALAHLAIISTNIHVHIHNTYGFMMIYRTKIHRTKIHRTKIHRTKIHQTNIHQKIIHRTKIHRIYQYIES